MTITNTEANPATLQQIIAGYTLPELKRLAKALRIRGFSKMKKADLVDAVSHELFDEWLLDSILLVQDNLTFEMSLRSVRSGKPVKAPNNRRSTAKPIFPYILPSVRRQQTICTRGGTQSKSITGRERLACQEGSLLAIAPVYVGDCNSYME